jgi:hypothetical protein
MLLFHYITDLSIIGQTVINSVYSIQGLRQTPRQLEQRLQQQSNNMVRWLRKIPEAYRFSLSTTDDRYHIEPGADYVRERITHAIYYYSARITLGRFCLSHKPNSLQKARNSKSKGSFRAKMTLSCLQASCSLLSVLPDKPDTVWLTTVTPWWAILHYMMQATTALMIGLSTCATSDKETNTDDQNKVPPLTREMLVKETRKAFFWLHNLAFSSRAARRAFMICPKNSTQRAYYLFTFLSTRKPNHVLRCQILDILVSAEGRSSSFASQQPPTTSSKRNHRELNCVRISTQEISADNESEGRGFGGYLPIDRANAKIRSALLSSGTTKDVQVAGIGTTKNGYSIQPCSAVFKDLG